MNHVASDLKQFGLSSEEAGWASKGPEKNFDRYVRASEGARRASEGTGRLLIWMAQQIFQEGPLYILSMENS